MSSEAYRRAGVDIDAADSVIARIRAFTNATKRPGVLSEIGGFGGLFEVSKNFRDPVLVSGADGVTVAFEIAVDDELALEGRVYELIHRVNSMRKDAGLELTDRITLSLPASDADLLEHAGWIARETLADHVGLGGVEVSFVRR